MLDKIRNTGSDTKSNPSLSLSKHRPSLESSRVCLHSEIQGNSFKKFRDEARKVQEQNVLKKQK